MWAKRRTSTSGPVGCLGWEQTFYDDHVGHIWDTKLDKVETLAMVIYSSQTISAARYHQGLPPTSPWYYIQSAKNVNILLNWSCPTCIS